MVSFILDFSKFSTSFGLLPLLLSTIMREVVKCHILTSLALASLTSHCGRNEVLPRGHRILLEFASYSSGSFLWHTRWQPENLQNFFLRCYTLKKLLVALFGGASSSFFSFSYFSWEVIFLEWSFSNKLSQPRYFIITYHKLMIFLSNK